MLSYTERAFGCARCGHEHAALLKKAPFEDKGGQKCEFLLKKAYFEEKSGQNDEVILRNDVFKGELRMAMVKRNQPEDRVIFGLILCLSVFLVENRIQNVSESVAADEETILEEW